jgi:hypothetical protein
MMRRARHPLAWGLWLVPQLLLVVALLLATESDRSYDAGHLLLFAVTIMIPCPTVGVLILAREPRNAVGWVFWTTGFLLAFESALHNWAAYDGGSLPAAATLRSLSEIIWFVSPVLALTLLPLLFPTGKPLSRRWGWLGWVSITGLLLVVISVFVTVWLQRDKLMRGEDYAEEPGLLGIFSLVGLVLITVGVVGSVASLVVRFRRSRGVARQQMKWFVYGLAVVVGVAAIWWFYPGDPVVLRIASPVSFLILPVTIGIAMLRYRLYEIDRIINRTLVYALLTLSLLLTYLGVVFVFGEVVRTMTGESSQIVVAASTLAVAALFRPLRARIQRAVDHRFYRRRYDATNTLETFSARLRDELDLQSLASELHHVINETMQPAHVSLWLRPRS